MVSSLYKLQIRVYFKMKCKGEEGDQKRERGSMLNDPNISGLEIYTKKPVAFGDYGEYICKNRSLVCWKIISYNVNINFFAGLDCWIGQFGLQSILLDF